MLIYKAQQGIKTRPDWVTDDHTFPVPASVREPSPEKIARQKEIQKSRLKIHQMPLHYMANPNHIIGDAIDGTYDLMGRAQTRRPNIFGTSREGARRYERASGNYDAMMREGLGLVPEAALNLGLGMAGASSRGVLPVMNELVNPVAGTGKLVARGVRPINHSLMDAIFNKNSPKVAAQTEDQMANIIKHYKTPEGRKRLAAMGVDPREAIERAKFAQEMVGTETMVGSYYNPVTGRINMDPVQLETLPMSLKQVVEHETGHVIQPAKVLPQVDMNNKGFLEQMLANREARARKVNIEAELQGPEGLEVSPTHVTNKQVVNEHRYFNNDQEAMPHLLEYRQGMLDRNIIDNRYDKINNMEMDLYRIADPDNRINSFNDWDNTKSKELIKKWVNKLPAVIGTAGVVGNTNNN